VPFDIADEDSVAKAMARSNVVVNLIGSRFETFNYSFHDVNVKIAWRLAKIAKQAGVERFIQVSALGADPNSASVSMRTKSEGEDAVRSHFPDATVLRPAPIFGHEDIFLNRFADIINAGPVFPNFGDHLAQKLQPIYVVDVAQAILNAIASTSSPGKTYELGGPEVFTAEEVLKMIRHEIFRPHRPIVWFPDLAGRLAASLWELFPRNRWRMFTQDILFQAKTHLVVGEKALSLVELNVTPTPISAVAGPILLRHRGHRGPDKQGQMHSVPA